MQLYLMAYETQGDRKTETSDSKEIFFSRHQGICTIRPIKTQSVAVKASTVNQNLRLHCMESLQRGQRSDIAVWFRDWHDGRWQTTVRAFGEGCRT